MKINRKTLLLGASALLLGINLNKKAECKQYNYKGISFPPIDKEVIVIKKSELSKIKIDSYLSSFNLDLIYRVVQETPLVIYNGPIYMPMRFKIED